MARKKGVELKSAESSAGSIDKPAGQQKSAGSASQEKSAAEDALRLDLSKKDKEIADLIEIVKRVQAEFENYKKRVDRDKEDFLKCAKKGLIIKLLPVMDNFELALKNKAKGDELQKGVELIYAELSSVLQSEGVRPIISEGTKFDPQLHEALIREESDKEDNVILEEFQKGYCLHDRVIRQSRVKVSKKKADKK